MKLNVMGISRNPAKLIFMPAILDNSNNNYMVVIVSPSEDNKSGLFFWEYIGHEHIMIRKVPRNPVELLHLEMAVSKDIINA